MSGLNNLSEKEKKEFAEEFEEFLYDFEEMLQPEKAFVFSCKQLGVSEAEGRELLGLVEKRNMKKIISLFQRNYEGDRLVRDEIVPGAEWVIAGEGIATRKWDGTSCLFKDKVLYKRYDAKNGKTPPVGFFPAQDPDSKTGHWPGWLPVGGGPEDRWHREAMANCVLESEEPFEEGTCELVGPMVQGNPEGFDKHLLIPHSPKNLMFMGRIHRLPMPGVFLNFEGVKYYLRCEGVEGIVWHHPDGRMVKIKAKDFGIKR